MNNTNKAFVGLLASMYFANSSHALAQEQLTDISESLADEITLRWNLVDGRKFGTNALSFKEKVAATRGMATKEARVKCRKGASQFDRFCHQYGINQAKLNAGKIPKFADLTNPSGVCDFEDDLERLACLEQDCMFDYCLHRRDEYLATCVEAEGNHKRDKFTTVYDLDAMLGALQHNGGDWTAPTCDAYYDFKQGQEDEQEQNLEDLQEQIEQAEISIAGKYIGPDYALPLSNLELLGGSNTADNARGSMTVVWMDFFKLTHKVSLGVGQQVNAYFPIVDRSWNWRDGDGWQRTGFNEACKWVQATFRGMKGGMFEDDYVRIEAKCYKMKGEPDGTSIMSEIKQSFGDTAEIVDSVA